MTFFSRQWKQLTTSQGISWCFREEKLQLFRGWEMTLLCSLRCVPRIPDQARRYGADAMGSDRLLVSPAREARKQWKTCQSVSQKHHPVFLMVQCSGRSWWKLCFRKHSSFLLVERNKVGPANLVRSTPCLSSQIKSVPRNKNVPRNNSVPRAAESGEKVWSTPVLPLTTVRTKPIPLIRWI